MKEIHSVWGADPHVERAKWFKLKYIDKIKDRIQRFPENKIQSSFSFLFVKQHSLRLEVHGKYVLFWQLMLWAELWLNQCLERVPVISWRESVGWLLNKWCIVNVHRNVWSSLFIVTVLNRYAFTVQRIIWNKRKCHFNNNSFFLFLWCDYFVSLTQVRA